MKQVGVQQKKASRNNRATTVGQKAYNNSKKRYAKKSYGSKSPSNSQLRSVLNIPECSQHYIKALYNPFEVPTGVCIPDGQFPLPSQKIKVTLRGTFSLGTTGFGFIIGNPSLCSDAALGAVTASTSVGTAATAFSAYTNLTYIYSTKIPYTIAEVQTNKQIAGRVVAFGMRVRYAGSEATRSGLYVACEEQDHATLFTESWNGINGEYANAATARPSGDGNWDSTVCYSGPTAPHMIDFQNQKNPISNISGVDTSPFVIACRGVAGDLVEYEMVQHVEYIGKPCPGKTVSHSDPHGYAKAVQTTKTEAAIQPLEPSGFVNGFRKFVNFMVEDAPKYVNAAIGIGRSIATRNPLPGLMGVANLVPGLLPSSSAQKMLTN